MSYLKGNYELTRKVDGVGANQEDPEQTKAFERFARQRLGGSIAFVMKEKTFVWNGDASASAQASASPERETKQG